MSLSQEIVDSIIAKNNVNANEKIYDALYGKASEKVGLRKFEISQNLFSADNYESDDDYIEQGEGFVDYEEDLENQEQVNYQ